MPDPHGMALKSGRRQNVTLLLIGELQMATAEAKLHTTEFTNPSHPSQVIGIVQSASAEQAKQAIESAHAYFDTWKRVPAEKRADSLFKAASIIRQRKFETSALICFEVGKSWVEA